MIILIIFSLILLTGCNTVFDTGNNIPIIVGAIIGGVIAVIIQNLIWGDKMRYRGGAEYEVTKRTGCLKNLITFLLFLAIGVVVGGAVGYILSKNGVISC